MCQSLFFNKVAGLRDSCEFCEISKNTFFTERLRTTASEIVFNVNVLKDSKAFLEVFCQIGLLKNFAKFTGNSPFNNVGLSPPTLLKKRPLHRCFPMKFAKFSRTPFLIKHLRWLLLKIVKRS